MSPADGTRSLTATELATQPDCWAAAVECARIHADSLPAPGARVLALGCGTSYYIAKSYAALREGRGLGITDAAVASEPPARREYDAVLALSRSGTTTEVLRALDAVVADKSIAIVGDASTPVGQAVDLTIALDFADERSVVQTRFATTTLALLRAQLGTNLDVAIADAHRALAAALPRPDGALDHLVMLGNRWTVGLAEEAALKCRETAGMWSESYAAMEYRHGPISATTRQTLVWSLDPLPDGLPEALAQTGATVEVGLLDPLAELIRVQRQALVSAVRRGRDPDAPANLERSVILS